MSYKQYIQNVRDARVAEFAPSTEAVPIGDLADILLNDAMNHKAESEPLPMALAMIDLLAEKEGETGHYARAAKIALAKIVSAGTELHALIGEAMERHIYNFDDGEIPQSDCAFSKGMKDWAACMAGDASAYQMPDAPLPWSLNINERAEETAFAFVGANGELAMPWMTTTNPSHVRNAVAMLESVNAQPSIDMVPEFAVIVDEGGIIEQVVQRHHGPAIIHIVNYDTEGCDPHEVQPIFQGEQAADVMATLNTFATPHFEMSNSPQFWNDVRGDGRGGA